MNTTTLRTASTEAQRRAARTGSPRDLERSRRIQRAYDRRLDSERRRARRQEERAQLERMVEDRLRAEPEAIRPVGLVSPRRAQYLMGAAAVAGGWIAVDCERDEETGALYAADTLLPSGDPVCDVRRGLDASALAADLRCRARGWARMGEAELAEDCLRLLDLVEDYA